jgi:hypothetical protein
MVLGIANSKAAGMNIEHKTLNARVAYSSQRKARRAHHKLGRVSKA